MSSWPTSYNTTDTVPNAALTLKNKQGSYFNFRIKTISSTKLTKHINYNTCFRVIFCSSHWLLTLQYYLLPLKTESLTPKQPSLWTPPSTSKNSCLCFMPPSTSENRILHTKTADCFMPPSTSENRILNTKTADCFMPPSTSENNPSPQNSRHCGQHSPPLRTVLHTKTADFVSRHPLPLKGPSHQNSWHCGHHPLPLKTVHDSLHHLQHH